MFTKTRRYPPVLFLTVVLASWIVIFNPGLEKPAYADPLLPFPVTMPNTVAEFLTMTGSSVGEVGVSTTAVGSLGPTAVALGGLATGYGIGMGLRKGFSMLWHWATGHDPTYADPPPIPGSQLGPGPRRCAYNDSTSFNSYGNSFPSGTICVSDETLSNPLALSASWSADTTKPYYTSSITITLSFSCYSSQYGPSGPSAAVTATSPSMSGSGVFTASLSCHSGGYDVPQSYKAFWTMLGTQGGVVGNTTGTVYSGQVVSGGTNLTSTPTRQCTNSATGAVTTVTGTAFHYTDGQDGDTLPSVQVPACPDGTYGTGFSVPTTRDSDGTSVQSPIPDWTAPSNYMPTAGFPECPLPDSCTMTLIKHNPDNTLTNCTGTIACQGWHDWPKSGPTISIQTVPSGANATEPARINAKGEYVTCQWGPYTLSSDECVDVATEPANPPAPADGSITNCLSGAISWNPIDWVFVPVKCVLTWAFEPTPSQMTQWQTRAQNIASKPPVNIMASGVDYLNSVKDIWAACMPTCAGDGTTYGFPVPGEPVGTTFDPIASAGNTMQTDPKGQTIYGVMQVGIIGGFVWWAWRRIGASFGGKEST